MLKMSISKIELMAHTQTLAYQYVAGEMRRFLGNFHAEKLDRDFFITGMNGLVDELERINFENAKGHPSIKPKGAKDA